jgi:hypothetical protein
VAGSRQDVQLMELSVLLESLGIVLRVMAEVVELTRHHNMGSDLLEEVITHLSWEDISVFGIELFLPVCTEKLNTI